MRTAAFPLADATEREATWQPIDNTPMHPEYPCAHCIVSSAVASAIEAMLGTADIPGVTMTSPTAPGLTHRLTNLNAYADEVAAARIAAGFHYPFSTVVGQDMGRQIGTHTVKTIMQPLEPTSAGEFVDLQAIVEAIRLIRLIARAARRTGQELGLRGAEAGDWGR